MQETLSLQLEAVRTVLQNSVNTVSVCVDRSRETGVFYTQIAIVEPKIRREVAGLLVTNAALQGNRDFIGSFTRGDALNLIFLYRPENRLLSHEELYGVDFVHRREMAVNLLTACAETQMEGPLGLLLLNERNLNLGIQGDIYFNYFLDFADWQPEKPPERFYSALAARVFALLARAYPAGSIDDYPAELQVLYRKADAGAFYSIGSVLSFVRALPDAPQLPRRGLARVLDRLGQMLDALRRHSMAIFLGVLVAATLGYLCWQVALRVSARRAAQANIVYQGLAQIGEVDLGDENA